MLVCAADVGGEEETGSQRSNGAKRKRPAQALRAKKSEAPNGKPYEHPRAATLQGIGGLGWVTVIAFSGWTGR